MTDCIFCKIIAGDINSVCLYEDEYNHAFKDINPQPAFLVIPKAHHLDERSECGNSQIAAKCLEAIAKLRKT